MKNKDHEARDINPRISVTENSRKESFNQHLEQLISPFDQPQLPADRLYFQNHTWFRHDTREVVTIGIDHLGARMLGPVGAVVLPQAPLRVPRFAPVAWVLHAEGAQGIKTPITGTILITNPVLKTSPNAFYDSPYDDGWFLRFIPEDPDALENRLLSAREAADHFRRQGAQLREQFQLALPTAHATLGSTLFDGGRPLTGIQDILGSKKYFSVVARIFVPE